MESQRVMKKCPFCAEEIYAEAIVCKHCGRDLASSSTVQEIKEESPKSGINPWPPTLLNVLPLPVMGCGYAYLGHWDKFALVVGLQLFYPLILRPILGSAAADSLGPILLLAIWVWSMFDASSIARKSGAKPGGRWKRVFIIWGVILGLLILVAILLAMVASSR